MDRKQFIDALFARAKETGFEACEVYYSATDSFDTDVFKNEIIKYSAAESLGLGFTVSYVCLQDLPSRINKMFS